MIIDISGCALRILDDFIHYASTYPKRLADAMWWCEDPFIDYVRYLKDAYDEAMVSGHHPQCKDCGD